MKEGDTVFINKPPLIGMPVVIVAFANDEYRCKLTKINKDAVWNGPTHRWFMADELSEVKPA